MDTNHNPDPDHTRDPLSEESIIAIRMKIRECISTRCDPNGPTIKKFCEPLGFGEEDVSRVFNSMISSGELKQKEDSIEHEWIYREGVNW